MTQAATRLNNQERHRIEAALKRIDTGQYVYCVICDEEIAEGRLRFDPSVLTCIDCAPQSGNYLENGEMVKLEYDLAPPLR